MRRRWLVAILAAALLLPSTTLAQSGSVRDLLAGDVLRGQTGETDDLELTAEEFTAAIRRVEELRAGLIVADPATLPTSADPERLTAIEAATTARLQEAGMIVDRCVVTPEVTAAACMEQLFQGDALAILTIGDFGDLSAAAEVPLRNRVIVVGVGSTILGDGAVTLDVNAQTAAREQALAAGRSLGLRPVQRKGNALIVAGSDPSKDDPVRQTGENALRNTAPKVKVAGRVGPAEVRSAADIAPLLVGSKPIRVMIGEGLVLDQLDAAGLETLPENLRLVAWSCSGAAREAVDLAGRLRGCVATADEAAGEAAANVVLAIKTSRDVPERIEIPVYSYRGTLPVGPGSVELGNRFTQESPDPTPEEVAAATTALTGQTVGLILPAEPGSDKETAENRAIREGIEQQVTALGGSITTCVGAKTKARGCFEQLQDEGVVAIMPIATGGDLGAVVRTAVESGVMVVGVNETRLGDAGGVYVYVNPRRVARLSGRMAGAYADRTWKAEPVDAAVFNDEGAAADDLIANAVERALVQTDSLISPVARFAAKNKTQVANAVRSMMRKYPSVRLIVGRHAADAAPVLIKKRGVNPDLVIYAQECTDDIVAAIDAGVDTGGWVKGCVDRNPAGAGKLAGDVLTRLAGGSRVPEINEVQVIPYEPGFRG
jgi:hypothetical protein